MDLQLENKLAFANLVTYVASPLSSATNGASLRVDGGGGANHCVGTIETYFSTMS